MTPTARTRVFALLGDPVAQSLSPAFQNAALAAARLDGVYVALRCAPADVPGLVRSLANAGGGGNVTKPHKQAAAESVDRRTAAVEATGACNTFWLEEGRVCGDNTDVEGAAGAVRALLGREPAGARVLLLGAGGSARAVAHALVSERVERLVVLNRTLRRADELASRLGVSECDVCTAAHVHDLADDDFDLVVNATSLGMDEADALPLPLDGGPRFGAALDLVYSRRSTPWVRILRSHGVPAADGREMLLRQGAAAFRRWWGVEPPLGAMRAALEDA
ncbi:MAG TPA: shikimate dehydrogenase [Longimicrobiaceae bacterium]|nr:shikimate dehydrogenase [Longimicrobiaceae bacterium]